MNIQRMQVAFDKYGFEVCKKAYDSHTDGNGARTIGYMLGLKTRQADAAIDAYRFFKQTNKA